MDLRAAVADNDPILLAPGMRELVPTGLIMEIPRGFEGQVRPRSGLALKNGLTCLNSPGTIDSDYRGELMVLLINHGDIPFTIERGMRIAQLVIAPVIQVDIEEASLANETVRGASGFGSTGT
jgi:dUTP pyrophosphatase